MLCLDDPEIELLVLDLIPAEILGLNRAQNKNGTMT
jgi:hypothetical protein